jgi:hypothetical protein
MADSQFFAIEPLSVLRQYDASEVRQKVSDLVAWLNGAVWRVRVENYLFSAHSQFLGQTSNIIPIMSGFFTC